ncbi:hypothetical protein ASPZODRAFT_19538 [Penicilliopsis zonata CBS 506.65]|uniref:Uncharacterized protein n=1 Tax=Penicilliopsis zonata CBS 506.65 TaxID=1073090 RepID=A0A1L9S8G8_9EURO|nr:hypothetical protein ASPZODRAFT_19538 [Penicilliopsis zonata CBS 506.65]OJJ43446.1 hypothetical protein ASPZODRAFT_19538 [Penicilliopsis zonata CBS 506.65]
MAFIHSDTPTSPYTHPPSNQFYFTERPRYYAAKQIAMGQFDQPPAAALFPPRTHSIPRKHSHGSLLADPSAGVRAEQVDFSTWRPRRPSAERPVSISPFRSVQRMKEPFPLRLPTSPSFDSSTKPVAQKETKQQRPLNGFKTLRNWCSDQNLAASLQPLGLLPSPSISEPRASKAKPSPTFFPQTRSEIRDDDGDVSDSCYSPDLKIGVACDASPIFDVDKENQPPVEVSIVPIPHERFVPTQSVDEHSESMPSIPTPETQSTSSLSLEIDDDKKQDDHNKDTSDGSRERAETMSSEASSWVPSNLTYCQNWLQGVLDEKPKEANRRKFQIVQHSPPRPSFKVERKRKDEPVRLAFATKPRLVDISRQSSHSMGFIPPIPQHPIIPSTPDQQLHEVSAFSPDTPLEMPDSGYAAYSYLAEEYPDANGHGHDQYSDSASATSESVASTVVGDETDSEKLGSFSPPKTVSNKNTTRQPAVHDSPSGLSNMSDKEWWDHEWTLDQLDQSVKDFPRAMLRLTSPVIMFLRKSDEDAILRPFRKIFPDVPENLLDCLCAVLIARNYIVPLANSYRKHNGPSHGNTQPHPDPASKKGRTPLGVHCPTPSASQFRDRVLGARSVELRKDLDNLIDKLLLATSGRTDETIKAAITVLTQVLEAKS